MTLRLAFSGLQRPFRDPTASTAGYRNSTAATKQEITETEIRLGYLRSLLLPRYYPTAL